MNHPAARPLLLVALAGCAGTDTPEGTDPPPVDTPGVETVDTIDTVDSDPPVDTPPDDTPVDTPPPLTLPPASWGAGFVDISGTLLTTDAYDVVMGDRAAHVPPDTTSGQWTDLDQDGTPEILITTRVAPDQTGPTPTRVFRWVAGELVRAPDLEARLPVLRSGVILTLDLDQDGFDDLLQTDREAMFWSRGARAWRAPQSFNIDDAGAVWSTAAAPWDFDHDGVTDLMLGDARCAQTIIPYLQDTPGALVRRTDLMPTAGGFGARPDGVLIFRLPDGRTVFGAMGSSCDVTQPHPGFLVEEAPGSDTYAAVDLVPPDALFKLSPEGAGRPLTMWAPMGASVSDLDDDGVQDMMLSLGFDWLTVLQGQPDGTFVDRTPTAALISPRREWGDAEATWSVVNPDLDQDGHADILLAMGDDHTMFHLADGYTYVSRAWWNGGDFRFVDVGPQLGVDLAGGWKAITMADPDRDGDADLILGGRGVLPRVLRNDIDTGNHGLSLLLHGTLSDPYALGAAVEVEVDGLAAQHRVVGNEGNCGAASPPLLFFGTATATEATRARVRWPSGYVQEVGPLAAGTMHELTEPPLLSAEATEGPADGATVVAVHLLPHDLSGAPDPAATVSLTVDGAGALVDGPVWTGADWVAHVQAPAAPGVSTLRATFDGAPLQVRPKIRWR